MKKWGRDPCRCSDARNGFYSFFILYRGIKLSVPLSICLCFFPGKKCVVFIRSNGASQVGGEADILIRSYTATLQRNMFLRRAAVCSSLSAAWRSRNYQTPRFQAGNTNSPPPTSPSFSLCSPFSWAPLRAQSVGIPAISNTLEYWGGNMWGIWMIDPPLPLHPLPLSLLSVTCWGGGGEDGGGLDAWTRLLLRRISGSEEEEEEEGPRRLVGWCLPS